MKRRDDDEAYDGEADDGAVSRIGGCYEAAAS
jgi:hypothetical protein